MCLISTSFYLNLTVGTTPVYYNYMQSQNVNALYIFVLFCVVILCYRHIMHVVYVCVTLEGFKIHCVLFTMLYVIIM